MCTFHWCCFLSRGCCGVGLAASQKENSQIAEPDCWVSQDTELQVTQGSHLNIAFYLTVTSVASRVNSGLLLSLPACFSGHPHIHASPEFPLLNHRYPGSFIAFPLSSSILSLWKQCSNLIKSQINFQISLGASTWKDRRSVHGAAAGVTVALSFIAICNLWYKF